MRDTLSNSVHSWRSLVSSSSGPKASVTRHVLLALSLYMSERGDSCFPSYDTLQADTGLSRQSIAKHLRLAVEGHWISVSKAGREGQEWKRNQYRATRPSVVSNLDCLQAKGGPPRTERQSTTHEKAVKEVDSNTHRPSTTNQFALAWESYGKKVSRSVAEKAWSRLPESDRTKALKHIPLFVGATPEVTFRPNLSTYLNQRRWEDEQLPVSATAEKTASTSVVVPRRGYIEI